MLEYQQIQDIQKCIQTQKVFYALKPDGTLKTPREGILHVGANAKIYSAPAVGGYDGAVLKSDGSIVALGQNTHGSTRIDPPTDSGYKKIYMNDFAFLAIKDNGDVSFWGDRMYFGSSVPSNLGIGTKIYSSNSAFVALKTNGSIVCLSDFLDACNNAPTDSGYTKVYSNQEGFVALKPDGTAKSWGKYHNRNNSFGSYSDYVSPANVGAGAKVYANEASFVALKPDGSLVGWGHSRFYDHMPANVGAGAKIYATSSMYVALKSDGTLAFWGYYDPDFPIYPPTGVFTNVYTTRNSFIFIKADGTAYCWRGHGVNESGGEQCFD